MNQYLFDENRKIARALAVLAALVVAVGLLGGCGYKPAESTGDTPKDNASVESTEAPGSDAQEDGEGSEPVAMGRYVETVVDISEYSGLSHGITLLEDGSLLIPDEKAGQIISKDGGETWETAPIPGIPSMADFVKEKYIFDMAAAPDGTVAVLATNHIKDGGDFEPCSIHVAGADGTIHTLESLTVSEDEKFLYGIDFSPEGELFATVVGNGTIYQVDVESGTLTKYLTMEWRPDLIKFQGDYMFFLTSDEGITIYDRKEKKWVEDSALETFMKENYLDSSYYVNETYTVYMEPGEEGVLYIAGKEGLFRHVIGGSAIEQVIDGALSSFSNPSMGLCGLATFGENEFAVSFGSKVSLFRYDPDVPTVPENLVTVYSLEEWDAVRQAIAQYQTEHPDTFVRYEVALTGTDGKSREDAIKKLNTELMAGKGPDVIILDELPAKSYVEKGILMDLKPHIDGLTGDAVLLPNIVDAFTENGSVYMMPVSFSLPMVGGRQEDVEGITDYASLADTVERLREENPEAGICDFFSGEATVRWFLPVAATAFSDASGNIKEELVRDYLADTQRIYKAANEGISDSLKDQYRNQKNYYTQSASERSYYYHHLGDVGNTAADFLVGDTLLAAGMLYTTYGYQQALSMSHTADLSDVVFRPFDGMSEGVFAPSMLVGLNASSAHQKEAEQFFDVIMGTEVQSLLYDGFMTNQSALEMQLSPQWKVMQNGGLDVDYGEVSSQMGGSFGDGREFHLDIFMPTKEEYQALYDRCCKVHTPYVADAVVEEAVITIGGEYLDGYWSLDEAMQKIMAKVQLYMAE